MIMQLILNIIYLFFANRVGPRYINNNYCNYSLDFELILELKPSLIDSIDECFLGIDKSFGVVGDGVLELCIYLAGSRMWLLTSGEHGQVLALRDGGVRVYGSLGILSCVGCSLDKPLPINEMDYYNFLLKIN